MVMPVVVERLAIICNDKGLNGSAALPKHAAKTMPTTMTLGHASFLV